MVGAPQQLLLVKSCIVYFPGQLFNCRWLLDTSKGGGASKYNQSWARDDIQTRTGGRPRLSGFV